MANSLLIAVLAKLGHQVDRMSAGFHVLLYVVTLGFYGWYWAYRAQRGTRRRTGEGVGGPFGLLIWIVIPAVSAFLIPSQVRRAYEKAGRDAPVRGWTGLWLFPFGILIVPAIVWFVKVHTGARRPGSRGCRRADRRLGGRARADAHRTLGSLRDTAPQARLRRASGGGDRPRRRARGSSGSVRPTRARSPRSRRPGGRTTCLRRASAPASTARSRSSST